MAFPRRLPWQQQRTNFYSDSHEPSYLSLCCVDRNPGSLQQDLDHLSGKVKRSRPDVKNTLTADLDQTVPDYSVCLDGDISSQSRDPDSFCREDASITDSSDSCFYEDFDDDSMDNTICYLPEYDQSSNKSHENDVDILSVSLPNIKTTKLKKSLGQRIQTVAKTLGSRIKGKKRTTEGHLKICVLKKLCLC